MYPHLQKPDAPVLCRLREVDPGAEEAGGAFAVRELRGQHHWALLRGLRGADSSKSLHRCAPSAVTFDLATLSGDCFAQYAHGAPPAPLFPTANETVCACQSWGKVSCATPAPNPRPAGWQPKTNLWPCDPVHRPGSEFWYCEDGPGWKPPAALRERAAHEQQAEQLRGRQLGATAIGLGGPSAPANVFETLWTAVPLKKAPGKGAVEADLTALTAAGKTAVHSIRCELMAADVCTAE